MSYFVQLEPIIVLTAISFVLGPRTINSAVTHMLLGHTFVVSAVYHSRATFFTVQFIRLIFTIHVAITLPVFWNAAFHIALEPRRAYLKEHFCQQRNDEKATEYKNFPEVEIRVLL